MRKLAWALSFCSVLGGGIAPLRADPPLFMWVDKAGVMHATDRLQSVPEPWFSMYSARLKDMEARGLAPSAPLPVDTTPPPPAPAPASIRVGQQITSEQVQQQRNGWKSLVARWRAELAAATAALQKAEQAYNEAGMNPILRQTPEVKEQLLTRDQDRQAARQRVEVARNMLQDALPKKAREEHVPPLWLQ